MFTQMDDQAYKLLTHQCESFHFWVSKPGLLVKERFERPLQDCIPSRSDVRACRGKNSLDSIGLSSEVWDTLEIMTMDAEQALQAEQSFAELPADQKARFKPQIAGLDKSKLASISI